jgi:hypothetical protein
MDAITQALGYEANFNMMAIHALVKCLTENGALRSGQVEQVLRETIDSAGKAGSHLDYILLQALLDRLEGREPTSRV